MCGGQMAGQIEFRQQRAMLVVKFDGQLEQMGKFNFPSLCPPPQKWNLAPHLNVEHTKLYIHALQVFGCDRKQTEKLPRGKWRAGRTRQIKLKVPFVDLFGDAGVVHLKDSHGLFEREPKVKRWVIQSGKNSCAWQT